jgi:prepilin-type N-terminal cleavage/methylation domain-containing protein
MNCKNKSFTTKRKAFTLIELLIVIAIIGILFIVLVSKVDFATDKAKATGVQTDFRSFQMAFDTVAKENAGFNTFGWDTGDANQNGKRDSYDEGDNGAGGGIAKNGIQDGTEVFTGHKIYDETFTKVYSLKKNGTGSYDRDALNRLETAINANLDPKLHITIKDDGEIVMANGAQDPWNKEYHGWYITNAEADKQDRGAIVMYSDGANNEFGSEHTITNGIVHISIPGSNKAGKDDYAIVSVYTYVNGYGEIKNVTSGFSNNQQYAGNNSDQNNVSDSSLILYNTRYIGKQDSLDQNYVYFEFHENGLGTYGEVNSSDSFSFEFEVITAYNLFVKEFESLSQSEKDDLASSFGLPDSYNDSDLFSVLVNNMSSIGIDQEDVLIIEPSNREVLFIIESQTILQNRFFGGADTTFVANP